MSEENSVSTIEHKVPKIKDLYSDVEKASELNDLNVLLNSEPQKSWVLEHPFAKKEVQTQTGKIKVPLLYIPVQRLEYLMTAIFLLWRLEIKEVKVLANSVCCIVRLHYFNPVLKVWEYQDGVGATPIQTASGAGALDFDKMSSNAIQIGAPAAESYAFKDAAEKIGKLFGKDMNRSDYVAYHNLYKKFDEEGKAESEYKEKADKAGEALKEELDKQ